MIPTNPRTSQPLSSRLRTMIVKDYHRPPHNARVPTQGQILVHKHLPTDSPSILLATSDPQPSNAIRQITQPTKFTRAHRTSFLPVGSSQRYLVRVVDPAGANATILPVIKVLSGRIIRDAPTVLRRVVHRSPVGVDQILEYYRRITPELVLDLAEDNTAHDRVPEKNLRREDRNLIRTANFVQGYRSASPRYVGDVGRIGAVESLHVEPSEDDAVHALKWEEGIPIEATQFGAGSWEEHFVSFLLVPIGKLACKITHRVLILRSETRWGNTAMFNVRGI
uniref:(northern house mosquito) hypothetical protein n=1 Tax=Culex pipiens TaxID=7175 RepID=A0A8D8CK84_CULPI